MSRFSLRTLLLVVLAAAVVCFAFFGHPHWVGMSLLGATIFFLPPAILSGIVFCRGYGRAFAIGCIAAGGGLPFLYFYVFLTLYGGIDLWGTELGADGVLAAKVTMAVFLGIVGVSGVVGMVVRWLANHAQKRQASSSTTLKPYSVLQSRVTRIVAEHEESGIAGL